MENGEYVFKQSEETIYSRLRKLNFSNMESRVIKKLVEIKTDKKIAAMMKLSPATIGTHVSNIMRKAGVHSRGELITWLFSIGLDSDQFNPGNTRTE
jgi:DNA-binding CsgD family transcriptional regulator